MSNYRDDIERYLRGDMTPSEMHALERKALRDPFLADALEGASDISPAEFSSDIDALTERISRKTRSPGAVRWYYKAAAAVFLVGISAVMIFYLSNSDEATTSIALNTPAQSEVQQPPSAGADTAASQEPPGEDAAKGLDSSPAAPLAAREQRRAPQDVQAESETYEKVEEATAPADIPDAEVASQAEGETLAQSTVPKKLKTEPAAVEVQRERGAAPSLRTFGAEATSRTVIGQVTDAEDGMPLPGVNVTAEGAATGTVTDINGYYEIHVPATAKKLAFSFVGLNTVEAAVPQQPGDSTTVDVKMAPDISALSEVVVVGYGDEGERGFEEIKWEPAEPEGGKRAFRRYLETNLRYPRIALENKIEGKVTVQFTIEPTGNLTDFRVIRGLGYGCDEEVIRLIREGPKWKPTKRNDEPVRGKGRVKLKFELPPDKK
ncbi:MAG TPA: TonB family protein [Cyclobacteriaceae bacterium]